MGRAGSTRSSHSIVFCPKSSVRAVIFPRRLTEERSHHKGTAGHLNHSLEKETQGTIGRVGCSSCPSYQAAIQD